ncbi:hypothetical protein H9P43_006549 [Blastocladiella emersonii ATCC 22665]|nr:hypothetical protein H9P43_006549 [Blastocladiella emersonii ATCC 22665]
MSDQPTIEVTAQPPLPPKYTLPRRRPDIARAAEDLASPTARRASRTDSVMRTAADVADTVMEAQEAVLAISEYLGMAEVVAEFLGDIAKTVPFGGTIAKCFSLMYQAERNAEENDDKASTLFKRVTFVLDTVRNLYQIGKWNVDSAQSVLGTIELSVQECAKYFHKYRAKSAFQRRFYSTKIRERFAALDAGLSAALAQLQLVLQVETVLRLEPTPTFTKPSREDTKAEEFIQSHGGADAFANNPDLVEQLAKAIGVEYSVSLVSEVSQRFDALEASLDAGFQASLDALAEQAEVLDEVKDEVAGLARRGAAYEDIFNDAIRKVWQRCGWGATVPLVNLIEVFMAETKARFDEWYEEWEIDVGEYLMDGFRKHLKRLDADNSGLVTVREINDFFVFDFGFVSYAFIGVFYMRKLEKDLLQDVAETCREVRDRILELDNDAAFIILFKAIEPELLTLAHLCERSMDDELGDIDPSVYDAAMTYVQEELMDWMRLEVYTWENRFAYLRDLNRLTRVQAPHVHRHFSTAILKELGQLKGCMDQLGYVENGGNDTEDGEEGDVDEGDGEAEEEDDGEENSEEEDGEEEDAEEEDAEEEDAEEEDAEEEDAEEEDDGEEEDPQMLDQLTSCLYEIAVLFEAAFPDTIMQLDAIAKQATMQYGHLATRGSTDWSCIYDFPPTTLQEPFPLTAWVPNELSPDVPENAVIGGTLFGEPTYLAQALVNVGGRTNLVPSFAYKSPTTGEWKCKAAIAGVQHAASFQWLMRARNVHIESTVNQPADHILKWVPLRLDNDAPHPLAGRAGIEYRKHETRFVRFRIDDKTVLPGKLFIKDGQMEASFVLPRADGDGAYEYTTLLHRSKSSLRRPLSRDISIEILIADSRNIAFYQHFEWNTLAEARARNAQPIVAGGTSKLPAYLAWIVGAHSMRLGMVFADEDYALLGEDPFGGDRDDDDFTDNGIATPHFRVLTGVPGAEFESGPYRPHPQLSWKKTSINGDVQAAHSGISAVIVNQSLRGETMAVARTVSASALPDKPHLGRRVLCVGQWSWVPNKNDYEVHSFDIPFIPTIDEDDLKEDEKGEVFETLHFDVSSFRAQYPEESEGTEDVYYMLDADGECMTNHTFREI